MNNLNTLLEIAIKASIDAGDAMMKVYSEIDFGIEIKADKSLVTKADKIAHEIIDNYLKTTNIPVLSEEGASIDYEIRKNWNQLWIVDPLDGTKEFINKNGEFTVNIALVENQIPILGVVYCPALHMLYYGSKESGSFKLTISESLAYDLTESVKLPLVNSYEVYTVVASRSHLSEETSQYIKDLENEHGKVDMISKGSSLKFCIVAEGLAQCYPRFAPTMEWDTAAGHAVCKYAGFIVMDWNTQKEKLYNNQNLLNNWFLVK